MQVSNIQLYKNNFDAYTKITGYSFSGLKGGGFTPTAKMRIGTDVHNYLLEPESYHHENRGIIVPIANAIKAEIGQLLPFLDTELTVTADFSYGGLIMPYKGRIDMVRTGKIVLDLKISEMPLRKSIPYFGYDNQVNGYMAATMSEYGMIIRCNPKTYQIEKIMIKPNLSWWQQQVEINGIPKEIY